MAQQLDTLLKGAALARREMRLADARRDLVEAVGLCRETCDRLDLARAVTELGRIERDLAHTDAAVACYEDAAGLYRTEGEPLRLAHSIRHMADIHSDAGRGEVAEALYSEALRIYRDHSGTPLLDLANALRGLTIVRRQAGYRRSSGALVGSTRVIRHCECSGAC